MTNKKAQKAIIDWHMRCNKDNKICTLFEDKEENYPAVEFRMKDGYVEIERISTTGIMEIRAEGFPPIHGQHLKAELTI